MVDRMKDKLDLSSLLKDPYYGILIAIETGILKIGYCCNSKLILTPITDGQQLPDGESIYLHCSICSLNYNINTFK
jgi:hypothetical protein